MMMEIKPLLILPVDEVQTYWQTLYMHDTLKYRLSNVDNPQWDDVVEMITRMGRHMFFMVDDGKLVGEFMLENYTGHAVQVHYSMAPTNTLTYSLELARCAMTEVLKNPLIKTLYGLTPTANRVACIFTLKAGFKKIGVLPSGMKYMGKIVDAMISVRT